MLRCTPFLLFDGNCAEAMIFYKECFGGELTLTKLADTPMKDQFPPEKHGRIINAQFKCDDMEISATDWLSDELMPQPGNTIAVFVVGGGYDELKSPFDALAVGAKTDATFQELHDMPFGTYGQLTDQFGVPWIFKGDKVASGQ
jgi:PhnB protein